MSHGTIGLIGAALCVASSACTPNGHSPNFPSRSADRDVQKGSPGLVQSPNAIHGEPGVAATPKAAATNAPPGDYPAAAGSAPNAGDTGGHP